MSELSVRETAARAILESPALGCGCCTDPAEGTDFDVEPGWRQVALADAVLAAVAAHDGLAEVLAEALDEWSNMPDDDIAAWIDRGGQPAHLEAVVRAWMVRP